MRRNGQGRQERKIITGTEPAWHWLMPTPVSGTPTLNFEPPGAVALPAILAASRASDSVDGINGDRRTLTDSGAAIPAGQGFTGPEWGLVFVVTDEHGWHPAQVESIAAGQIVLVDALSVDVEISVAKPASVVWRWWSTAVPPAASLAETGNRPIPWRVDYTGAPGTGPGNQGAQRATGIVHVVDRIFDTGLDASTLSSRLAQLLDDVPVGLHSYEPYIEQAHAELVTWLRAQIQSSASNRREDDIDGQVFHEAHARLAASIALERSAPQASEEQATKALVLAERALSSISWADPDADGIGEHAQPAINGSHFGGGTTRTAYDGTASTNPFDHAIRRI